MRRQHSKSFAELFQNLLIVMTPAATQRGGEVVIEIVAARWPVGGGWWMTWGLFSLSAVDGLCVAFALKDRY